METLLVEKIEESKGFPQIEFSKEYDANENCVNFNAYSGEDILFTSAKLLGKRYTATVWSTHPEIKRKAALEHLQHFYRQIVGQRVDIPKVFLTNFPVSIVEPTALSHEYAIPPYISSIRDSMGRMKDDENKTLIFDSQYVDFGIELPSAADYRRLGLSVPSKLERIMFTVSSNQISQPLAELIESTSAYPVKRESIVEHLRKSHDF